MFGQSFPLVYHHIADDSKDFSWLCLIYLFSPFSLQIYVIMYVVSNMHLEVLTFMVTVSLVNDYFPIWFVDNCSQWYDEAGLNDIVSSRLKGWI